MAAENRPRGRECGWRETGGRPEHDQKKPGSVGSTHPAKWLTPIKQQVIEY